MSAIARFQQKPKIAATYILGALLLVYSLAGFSTLFYYLGAMPRMPQPQTGRVYRVGAAYNVAVYVTKGEFDWANFLEYDMGPASIVCGLILCVLWIRPGERR
jgi:hypothetical protein